MTTTDDAAIAAIGIKQAVRDALSRYCRGLDRMDKSMAYAVFQPDAPAHYYDIYEGTGHGFIDWVWESHAGMERHSHQISNVLVHIDGNANDLTNVKVSSEAYVQVALWTLPDENGAQAEIIGRGRYLDRWVFSDARWMIAERQHVLDMQTILPLRGEAGGASKGYVNAQSRRDGQDASFAFIPPAG